jgi:hypothetical protein
MDVYMVLVDKVMLTMVQGCLVTLVSPLCGAQSRADFARPSSRTPDITKAYNSVLTITSEDQSKDDVCPPSLTDKLGNLIGSCQPPVKLANPPSDPDLRSSYTDQSAV